MIVKGMLREAAIRHSSAGCWHPRRGSILDRRGKVLAVSMENNFSVSPEMLGARPEDQGLNASVERVYPLGEIAGPVLGYVGKDGYGLGGARIRI